MPEVIDTAYVRIRPTGLDAFRTEAATRIRTSVAGVQREVAGAGRAASTATTDFDHFNRGLLLTEARALGLKSVLGGVSALFIGGAGIATLFHTATEEFSQFTQIGAATEAILTATGGAAHVTATGVQALATALEHKTGIDDEQIKSAENVLLTFRAVRNEVGQGNDVFDRATRSATDLSRVFGTDVPSTARQLGRALQYPTRGLLTLRRAGLTFTADQTKQIKALADTGQLLKAQTIILDEVDRRVGGTAESIGRTLPGALAILRERAKDSLGEYVKRLSESHDAAEAARQGGAALAAGFGVVKQAVETLGPPLVTVVKAANAVEKAIGAGPLLAALVGYKAIGVAVGLAARAQLIYARATAAATGTNAAEAASATAVAAATRVEIGSLAGATFALRGVSTAGAAAVAVNTEVAASEVAVGLAARAEAVALGAGRIALAAIGGPLGAAALGAGALAAGLILARRAALNAPGSLNAVRHALDDLNRSVEAGQAIRIRVTGGREAVTATQAAAQAALDALTAAQGRQAASTAAPGSLEQQALAEQVRVARVALTRASDAAVAAEKRLANAEADHVRQQRQQPGVIAATTRRIIEQTTALRDSQVRRAFPTSVLSQFDDVTKRLSESGSRLDRTAGATLNRVAERIKGLPSEKEIRIVFTLAAAGRSVDAIIQRLGLATRSEQILQREADARGASRSAILGENAALEQQFAAAEKILRSETKKLAVRKEAANQARQEAQAARDAVQNALDTLTNAQESLAASERTLADTIRSGQQAVTGAVRDAKTNLRSIGDSIAEAIGRFADQGAAKIGPSGPLAKQFQALRRQIIAGAGGPETQRAAQQIAARLQSQQGGDDVAARAKRRLDDLSDSFARGRIGPAQFNAGVQRILRDFGLNLRDFGKTFGSAALHDLQDEIRAARDQAQAIAAGPSRPGGGGEPAIIRPLQAVAQAQRDTRDATRNVVKATRDVARAQRDLQQKQLAEARATTTAVQRIARAAEAQLRVTRQRDRLTKPKPTGEAAKGGQTVVTSGAGAP